MVPDIPPEVYREYPPELVRFVADEAARAAEDVVALLAAAGVTPPPGRTQGLPAGILLDLGGVVRLRRWEADGFTAHLAAGLPTARQALLGVADALQSAAADPAALDRTGALARAVFEVQVTRFAWTAPAEFGADVMLNVGDEDALVETLAQFLWTHRRDAAATE